MSTDDNRNLPVARVEEGFWVCLRYGLGSPVKIDKSENLGKLPEKYCPICCCTYPWRFVSMEKGEIREFYRCLGCGTEVHKNRWDALPDTFMDSSEAKLRAEIEHLKRQLEGRTRGA